MAPSEQANALWKGVKASIETPFVTDAVVITASGNEALKQGRKNVDGFPALAEMPNYPLIAVGECDEWGRPLKESEGISHVTIQAQRLDV